MNDPINGRNGAMPLAELLSAAAGELRHLHPPAGLRERVLATARSARPMRPRRRGWVWALAGSGAAVGMAALLVAILLLLAGPVAPPSDHAARLASGFVPVASAGRWQQLLSDSATPAWLVTTEMPRDRLAALGLPFDPARAAEPVRAELLLHASGEVIAMRVIGQ